MDKIPCYDSWKLATPEYIEDEVQYCKVCDSSPVDVDNNNECPLCTEYTENLKHAKSEIEKALQQITEAIRNDNVVQAGNSKKSITAAMEYFKSADAVFRF